MHPALSVPPTNGGLCIPIRARVGATFVVAAVEEIAELVGLPVVLELMLTNG